MNIKLLREIIREEIERLNREKPIKEVLVREMHYDPKDSKRRVPDTIKEVEWIEDPKTGKRRKIERNKPVEPIYYHFSTLEEALEFMKEIEEKYRNYPIKLPIEKPLPGVLRIGAVEYMIIVRRFKEEELEALTSDHIVLKEGV